MPNWEFLFRCGPSKPLRFKLSYQKTSSQDSGNAPMIGLCSAIDQQFTVPTGQIVAAADRNNCGSPWERRLLPSGLTACVSVSGSNKTARQMTASKQQAGHSAARKPAFDASIGRGLGRGCGAREKETSSEDPGC